MNRSGLLQILKQDEWVKPFFRQYRRTLVLALILGLLTFICGGALMFNSGYLISKAASLPENILLIYIPIVLTRAFGIGRPVFRYLERLTSHNWVLKMTSKLRLKLYNVLEQDAVFFKQHYRTGDILGLLAEDIDHIQNLYLRTIFPTIIAWVLSLILVIGMGFFSWWFALWLLLFLAIAVLGLPLWSVLVNGARQERQKQLKHALYGDLTDNILGVSDWIFGQRSSDYATLHEKNEAKLRLVDRKLRRFQRQRDLLLQLLFGVITLALVIWTSGYFQGDHGGAANWIAAFVLTVFPLIDAFQPLSAAAQETNSYQDSLRRLNALPQERREVLPPPLLSAPFMLKAEAVSFAYPTAGKTVLQGLDLEIAFGEKLAILGRSGSGKSTLLSLLRGDLAVDSGRVTLNEIETAHFGDTISRYIGVIHQNPYLFNTTILNNVRIGNEDASEAEVWAVLERVGLGPLLYSLPEGLHTLVDEAGLRFSGGERHRLALARILLQDVPIILLDEPTVGLDPLTEAALLETFFTQLQQQTVVWITHHLQGVSFADRVIFLEAGQIKMDGTPEVLAQTNAHYRYLQAIDRGIF